MAATASRQARGRRARTSPSRTSSARRWTTRAGGPELREADVEGEDQGRRADDRVPDLLPDPPAPGSIHRRRAGRSRSTVREEEYSATRWSSRSPGTRQRASSEYYGVSGTDWVDAPILENPSETRTIDGRDYLLFYDGDRLRLVGFKTKKAAYWVNNTPAQSLDEGQMLSIATLDARVRAASCIGP